MTEPKNQTLSPDILQVIPEINGETSPVPQPEVRHQINLEEANMTPEELGEIALKLMKVMSKDKAAGMEITGAFENDDGSEHVYTLSVAITLLRPVADATGGTESADE